MRNLTLLSLLIIAGCTPMMSPGNAMVRVNRELDGHDVNEFFVSYGSASASMPAQNGGTLYQWVSIEPEPYNRPASILHYPGGHYASIGDGSNGESISGYCKVSVMADGEDRIQTITLVSDSIGKYSGSRCAEIFGQEPPQISRAQPVS